MSRAVAPGLREWDSVNGFNGGRGRMRLYLFKPFAAYADFNGRARRAEYWQWTLFMLAVNFGFSGLMRIIPENYTTPVNWVSWIWAAGTLIPSLAVTVRRFHDTNRTGWWALYLSVVPMFLLFSTTTLYFLSAKYSPGMKLHAGLGREYILAAIGIVFALLSYIPPLVFLLQNSNLQSNRFGVDPKKRNNEVAVF